MRRAPVVSLTALCLLATIGGPVRAAGADAVVATVAVPGQPFATVSTHDGRFVFVSVSGNRGAVVVFRAVPNGLERIGIVELRGMSALGMALLADDSVLLVADGEGVALIDAAAARSGAHTEPVYVDVGAGSGTIEVAATPDGRTAFAADEKRAQLSVLHIQRQPNGAPGAVRTGHIDVDRAPAGLALSPDGATLYVVSEIATRNATADAAGELTRRCGPRGVPNGTLTAIDVARGEVVARLAAGCSPVRVALTADGATAWVSVRGDDRVVAFDTAKLRTDAAHALIGQARVGSAPVGVALLARDTQLAVANSNRFDAGAGASTVTVLQLGPLPSVRSSIPAGSFPREFSVSPDGSRLYLTNFRSRTVEVIDVARL